jgi:MOSC domain-containing protein
VTGLVVGTVDSLWRFPVKSMLGEQVDELVIASRGVIGDRASALIDLETGKIISAKHPRIGGRLLSFRARYVEPPVDEESLPPVEITRPDGSVVSSDAGDIDDVPSNAFGSPVHFSSDPPRHPVIEVAIPGGRLDSGIGWLAPGTFQDGAPLSLVTTATLSALQSAGPTASFDPRRFRANFVVRTSPELQGFVENDWVGQLVSLGADVQTAVLMADPRCIVVVLGQEELPRDNTVLQVISKNNRIEVPGMGPSPCVGVYGKVRAPGVVKRGDDVIVAAPSDDEALKIHDADTRAAFRAMEVDLERIMKQLGAR